MRTLLELAEKKIMDFTKEGEMAVVTRFDIQFNCIECQYIGILHFSNGRKFRIEQNGMVAQLVN